MKYNIFFTCIKEKSNVFLEDFFSIGFSPLFISVSSCNSLLCSVFASSVCIFLKHIVGNELLLIVVIFNLQSFTKYLKLSFLLLFMYLLTARFVKSSHIQARILFVFLKNDLKQTLNSFNIKFQPHSKYQKSSCEVSQNLALFCNSIALILG